MYQGSFLEICAKLADFYLEKDKQKTINLYKEYRYHCIELKQKFPKYQKDLQWVENRLKEL